MIHASDIHELTKSDEPVTVVDVTDVPISGAAGSLHWIIDDQTGEHVFNVCGFGFVADNVEKIDHDARTIWIRP